MRIAIGNDHAATDLKFEIMEYVKLHTPRIHGVNVIVRFDGYSSRRFP